MSKNRNRAQLRCANNGREYRLIYLNSEYPQYWDEGIVFYPVYRRGFKNPNKQIFLSKIREYRTWKYNSKQQWRDG